MVVRIEVITSQLLPIIAICMTSCCFEKKEFYGAADANLKQQIKYVYGVNIFTKEKCGPLVWLAENGDTIQSANFKNGKLDGIARYYFEDNRIQLYIEAWNDLKHGVVKEYFENGQLKIKCVYRHNRLWNIAALYDSVGNRLDPGSLRAGTGQVRGYYPNGKLKHIGNFRDGYRDGKWFFYTDNGILMDSTTYVDGFRPESSDIENHY